MNNVLQFRMPPGSLAEAIAAAEDCKRKASDALAHYTHRARDNEYQKYKYFLKMEKKAIERVNRLKKHAIAQADSERRFSEEFK